MSAVLLDRVLPALDPMFSRTIGDSPKCTVTNARYHAFLNPASRDRSVFDVTYRLTCNSTRTEWIHLRACCNGASALQHRTVGGQPQAVLLPDLDAIAWRLPCDPGLPQLALLTDAGRAPIPLANGSDANEAGVAAQGSAVEVDILNYRAGDRCVLRYREGGWSVNPSIAFAKTFSDARGATGFRILRELNDLYFQSEALRVPAARAYDGTLRTLWLESCDAEQIDPGTALTDATLAEQFGRAIGTLHRHPIMSHLAPTETALIGEAHHKVAKIGIENPAARAPLQRAIDLLIRSIGVLPRPSTATLHGDLHLRQWLHRSGSLVLTDFDEVALGNPALDLANFRVDLLSRDIASTVVAGFMSRMLGSYRMIEAPPVSDAWIDWYSIVHWLNRAYRLFLQQRPGLDWALDRVMASIARDCVRLSHSANRVPE